MINVTTTQESDFPEIMEQQILDFWQQRCDGFIKGCNQKQLYWISLTSSAHTKAIVVVNGRVESVWKYQELFYHFFEQGYDVYSFDHRGQGFSDRVAEDQQIGHVSDFSHYVADMATIVNSFQLKKYEKRYLLAHSMGGTISTRYLQSYPNHVFDKVVLSAPMFGVHMSPLLTLIAPYWAYINCLFNSKPKYLTDNREYQAKPFNINPLTSSKVRYKWFRDLYENMPQLKVGGPSAHWVWQALTSAKNSIRNANKITIPTLLIQAASDVIVSNKAQVEFMSLLRKTNKASRLEIIENSKHEILFETDQIRDKTLSALHSFLKQN